MVIYACSHIVDELQKMTKTNFSDGDSEIMTLSLDRERLEHSALAQIRKHTLHPYNRLHSISEDAEFVKEVHNKYLPYPLIGKSTTYDQFHKNLCPRPL